MNIFKSLLPLLLVVCVLHAPELNAQTCADPLPVLDHPTGPSVTGNTCGNVDTIQTFCSSYQSLGNPDAVYQLNIGPTGRTFSQLSVLAGAGSPSFNPVVFIYSGDCASAVSCLVMADVSSSPVDVSATVLPAGNYFLVVTAAQTDLPGSCGEYTIQADGVLPVTLQSFHVE